MTTALSVITQLPATKAEMQTFIDKAITELLDGTRDIIKINIQLKILEDVIAAIRKNPDVSYAIMDEASKYPDKTFDMDGAIITKTSRTTYDYTPCKDRVYNDLVAQKKQTDDLIKAREAILKIGIDPATGDVFDPPRTSTSEFLTIKLK